MNTRKLLNKLLNPLGYHIDKTGKRAYSEDGLISRHNHDFMTDLRFRKAIARGEKADGPVRQHWRIHMGLWAASTAARLEGDFVECGVSFGLLSSCIMEYLDWNSMDKTFSLLDTFNGIDEKYLTEKEIESGRLERVRHHISKGRYNLSVDRVRDNFAEWERVHIIPGSVPETLGQVTSDKVAFLHLDMNCAAPEAAALRFFWDRLVPGAIVLLDDYGFRGYEAQKDAMDEVAAEKNVAIASLPTGQGMMIKPG